MKSVSKYYTQQHSSSYTYTLAFWMQLKLLIKLIISNCFKKLLDRETPIVIVRILLFWYSKQTVCIKWGRCISGFFSMSNGVRQAGILSPKIFSVYIDDLSDKSG